ncbi:MAG: hypothetical protein AAF152_06630, partial [Cyanobacteria bacterium P01_A01_bin.114]
MESQFKQLVLAIQGQSPESACFQAELAELVELVMRSRKVGRPPRGQPLTGVYQDLCDRIRQQVAQKVTEALANGLAKPETTWGHQIQAQATQAALDDSLLKGLALEAQAHPPQSPLRQHALMQLVEAIRASGRLAHPHRAKFAHAFYQLLYEEAVNRTLVYVCQKIDTYDPARGQAQKFMNWVNFRLDRLLIDCRREFSDRNAQELPNLNDLERLPQPDSTPSLASEVRDYIAADTDDLFKSAHVRNRPDASFQAIALARFANHSWEDISAQF